MSNVEVPDWLKCIPLAPEYRPTETEFSDPIAFISRVEEEASAFGICKVIPPLPKPSKKFVLANLTRSLSSSSPSSSPVFTTRSQELGRSDCSKSKKGRGSRGFSSSSSSFSSTPSSFPSSSTSSSSAAVHKQVWESGEWYTLEQFEAKARAFARTHHLKVDEPIEVEAMFWQAAFSSEKPIYIDYANDVPGSGFGVPDDVLPFSRKRLTPTRTQTQTMVALEGRRDDSRRSKGNDVQGNAGWKLSNSPWNLQVISKSEGSLTRFMPDEVPGVTSPMVYIAMLFSWFAWHVEDHELHSLNFLHMGAPKTWYAVPESHASMLEEVVRLHGYGSHVDRLDAFMLLGEKRTLLSPEVLVSSGVPCCRLVQNPGEFVVTFPRAYHVGFSHGFNCGEAANFATPKWLDVAKEAAVRRAAMNYLPMLSHQQLLYFLAMSFISRIPREFLPGARSSRLRGRQKEEREFAVKKAFLEDLMNEQRILNTLLTKKSTFRAVLWNTGMLPFLNDGHPPYLKPSTPSSEQAVREHKAELDFFDNKELHKDVEKVSYAQDMVGRLHGGDDDLPCGLDIDSGALACAACGTLGYPFMSILQPSDTSMEAFLATDLETINKKNGPMKLKGHSQSLSGSTIKVNSDTEIIKDHLVGPNASVKGGCTEADTNANINFKWNFSDRKMRPRIFCLKHGILVEEKLQSIGGAYLLVICHSDYLKIKTQALAIEDTGTQFHFGDIPMENASKEDLDLITISIDDGSCEDYEDWTAKMGFNLRHFVKRRKELSPNPVKTCLPLDQLFSDLPALIEPALRWNVRRTRTPYRCTASQRSGFHSGPICKITETTRNLPSGSHGNTQDVKKRNFVQSHASSTAQQDFSAEESPQLHDGRGCTPANSFEAGDCDANLSCCISSVQDAIHQINTIPNLPTTAADEKSSPYRETSTVEGGGRSCKAGEPVQDEHTMRNAHGHDNFGQHEIKANMTSSLEGGSDSMVGEFVRLPNNSPMYHSEVCQKNGLSIEVGSSRKTDANEDFLSRGSCEAHHDAGKVGGPCKSGPVIVSGRSDSNSVIDHHKLLQEHQNRCALPDLKQVPFDMVPIDSKTPDSVDLGDLQSTVASSSCQDISASQTISDANIPENIRINLPVKCYHRRKKIKTKDIASNTSSASSARVGVFDINGDDGQPNVEQNPDCRKKVGVQRKRELNHLSCSQYNFGSFARSPCEGLRARSAKSSFQADKRLTQNTVIRKAAGALKKESNRSMSYECGLQGCLMKFSTKEELALHRSNRHTLEGCDKHFLNCR